jgi:GMP reductase
MEIFDYDNILLLPRKCRVESRAQCDTSVQFGPQPKKINKNKVK